MLRQTIPTNGSGEKERAILVGLEVGRKDDFPVEDSLQELSLLAETAGAVVKAQVIQKRDKIDSAYYVGRGKLEEIHSLQLKTFANLIIFNGDLTPSQQSKLEEAIGAKVIDRTQLILDIFTQRAHTKEGKLQVELAQLNYLLPRLKGKGVLLSRLGGGIGTRGPGETKLEVDRRRIRARIFSLKRGIKGLWTHRRVQREGRKRSALSIASLVGYTNSGKSTLLNTLCRACVPTEDKLFATLDPTTRKVVFPNKQELLLTDTVGFIKKLPHHLVAAFQATLEEVREADLLLNVLDASSPQAEEQCRITHKVLEELQANDKPQITVLNKIDKLKNKGMVEYLKREMPPAVAISALKGWGLEELLIKIQDVLFDQSILVKLAIPYQDSFFLAWLKRRGKVLSSCYEEDKVLVEVRVGKRWEGKIKPYLLPEDK